MNKGVLLVILGLLAIGCSLTPEPKLSVYGERKAYMRQCLQDFLREDLTAQDTLLLCGSLDGLARGR